MTTELSIRYWNLAQTFPAADKEVEERVWPPPSPLSAKAGLWECNDPSLTLASQPLPGILSDLKLLPEKYEWSALPFETEESRWTGSPAGVDLLARAKTARRVVLCPAVWTRQSARLLDYLLKEGIDARGETMCSHGRIFYWNTRVGMRDLFLTIPGIRDMLIDSTVCHDPVQVGLALARLPDKEFVVKSNFALGGFGVKHFNSGIAFDPEDLYSPDEETQRGKDKGAEWAYLGEPYVVERLVGDLAANVSITVDCLVIDEDETRIIGMSRQLLAGHFGYSGIESLGDEISVDMGERITSACLQIGRALAVRGYRNHFNIDFVAAKDEQVYVADLNVRRSAPLDAHQLINRLIQMGLRQPYYKYIEFIDLPYRSEPEMLAAFRSARILFDGETGIIPCRYNRIKDPLEPAINAALLLIAKNKKAMNVLNRAILQA